MKKLSVIVLMTSVLQSYTSMSFATECNTTDLPFVASAFVIKEKSPTEAKDQKAMTLSSCLSKNGHKEQTRAQKKTAKKAAVATTAQ